ATGATRIEADIQIFYAGPVDKFSWIVPVPVVPEVDVGVDTLFARLEAATHPTFSRPFSVSGVCGYRPPSGGSGGCSGGTKDGGGASDAPGLGGGGKGDPGGPPPVDVAFRGDVGPY